MNHKFLKLSSGLALTLVAAAWLNTKNTSALYQSSLSAYVDNVKTQVDGDLLLDNPSVKREMNLNIGVTAKNKSGYKIVVNSKTDNTALNNSDPAKPDKIESITSNQALNNFTANTWGYKLSSDTNYSPIPSLSHPATVANNTEKEVTNRKTILNLGINLGDDLRPGDYINQLVVSVVANTYQKEAIMDKGESFNKAITYLGKRSSSNFFGHGQEMIEHFRRSATAPTAGDKPIEIQDNVNSDYVIKAWYKEADKTVYYYAETEKIFLAPDSSSMFKNFTHAQDLDLAKFDTSNVVNMMDSAKDHEKVVNAYLKLAKWQYDYVKKTGGPFNFINNKTYFEEIGEEDEDGESIVDDSTSNVSEVPEESTTSETSEVLDSNGLSKEDKEELAQAAKELHEDSSSKTEEAKSMSDSEKATGMNMANIIMLLVIVCLLGVVGVLLVKKKKSN